MAQIILNIKSNLLNGSDYNLYIKIFVQFLALMIKGQMDKNNLFDNILLLNYLMN